ncbi:MAG: glycosyltransferase A (GT-A) superfamily protein (DUF2064 family) [Flavobacteriales bacterium]|jgi:glycosyltransferase A (GT-A) superfamily protein (DUF2064 family)
MNTAIVVFADVTKSEVRSKKLLPELNEQANLELLRYMTNATCQLAKSTGMPVLHVNGALQLGRTFGERIQSAFQHAFNQGFENVVVIGNDCAGLQTDDLLHAASIAQSNKVALGPDLRGGTWLIGLNNQAFAQTNLTLFNWQKKSLFSELVAHFGPENTTELSAKIDLNSERDLRAYKQLLSADYSLNLEHTIFLHFLNSLLCLEQSKALEIANHESLFVQKKHMRAPPQWQAA